jgi:hypothetical protein
MPEFSDETIRLAWERSGGKCECARSAHEHPHGRCHKPLVWEKRGKLGEYGAWQVRHKDFMERLKCSNSDDVHKCEIWCLDCLNKVHEKSIHHRVSNILRWRPLAKRK